MTAVADPRESQDQSQQFRAGIARRLGLLFDESRWGFLDEVLRRRLARTKLPEAVYLKGLASGLSFGDELRELARELTVGETYFFRNIEQFRAVTDVVLPARIAARAQVRTLALLSVGCASGEEAYSLAMLVRQQLADPQWTTSILAIDVNPSALEKARAGRYSSWALRETPPKTQARWFSGHGREMDLDPTIQAAVTFEEHNLAEEDPALWRTDTYDVVFCRNVIMYFTPEGAQAVIARITRSLAAGGYLFLGHAETLRGLSHDYHLRHTHGTFYYQRKDVLDHAPLVSAAPDFVDSDTLSGATLVAAAADAHGETTWIDTIRRASDRIQTMAEETPAPTPRTARADLSLAMESLRAERFSEALALLRALPSESVGDPDALLLRAALLTHSGQLESAETACTELLVRDELNAGAHYLLALCREGTGDRAGAIDHDQVAVYLDPAFAMPRLHMGLLARRAGQLETARRELGLALPLLQREDTPRLLLFGGGFNRDALAALCRAELTAAGAEP